MKQSTKLLSLVLALVMAFSFVTVIGNAALVKSEVKYDVIDDADLSPEQVASIIMDLLDKLIADGDMSDLDLSILGKVRMDSLDHIVGDFYSLYDSFWWTIGSWLLGDVGDLNLDNLDNCQRANGDLNFLYDVLELLNVNKGVLSKVAYGIGTSNGLGLGLIGNFLDLGDIGDMLADIPQMLEEMVYDLLIYGSYGYNKDAEELGGSLPAEVDTLDEIINRAIGGLLTYPQDYEWVGEGKDAVKVWDEGSLLLPTAAKYGIATVTDYFSLTGSSQDFDGDGKVDVNSLFQILDKAAPFAIYDLGINALNHNLKKTLMEAVEVDFNEVDVTTLPADVKTDFQVDAVDGEETYVNYIAFDRIAKSGTTWYYTTMKNVPVIDASGNPVLDEEGNETSERVRKYYKANPAAANDFYSMINWDWNFYAPEPLTGDTTSDALNELNYEALIAEYGSITESLNHLLYVVYETALTTEVKAEFQEMTGAGWEDGATTDCIMDNLERLLKYLLAEHADKIFGSTSPYVAWEYEQVEGMSIIELIAHIGPTFFEDAMPQLIMPKAADGTVMFHDGVQILEFGAIVIREFITEIAPNVNYDEYIFEEGTVTSENDRQFKEQEADDWFNIILNMGLDIAYTYLNNITNFNTAIPDVNITETRWQDMLDDVIIWAANYVGTNSSSVLKGFDPAKISGISGPLNKLSYILNTLLPLGFINGCTTASYDFDVEVLFEKIKLFLTDFDLTAVVSLFGRNTDSNKNILDDGNIISQVLGLANDILSLVFGADVLPVETTPSAVVTQANLKTIIETLFGALYTRRADLLVNALPVVAKFVQDWGGEQEMGTPDIALKTTIVTTNGALTGAEGNDGYFKIYNGSTGVWRHYRDAAGKEYKDNQYKYAITNISAYNFDGSASSYISGISYSTSPIDFGANIPVTFNVANVPAAGAIARFVVQYTVYDEDENLMAGGEKFEAATYTWLNYNPTDANTEYKTDRKNKGDYTASIYSPQYVGLSDAPDTIRGLSTGKVFRKSVLFSDKQTLALEYQGEQIVDGIKWGNFTEKFKNAEWTVGGIRNFDSYSQTVTNKAKDDTHTYTVAGGVDEAAFAAANKQPGSTSSWTIRVYARGDANNYPFTLVFYDDIYRSDLISLVNNENEAQRTAVDYNTSGTFYADRVLVAEDDATTPDEFEKETNFTQTAWIDGDGNVVAAGTEGAKEVTVIDAAAACGTYMAALQAAIPGAWQEWNGNSIYTHEALYKNLRVAVNDVEYIKKTAEDIEAEGGKSLAPQVEALKDLLDEVEATYSDDKDYTDYKMYRWNRYNDVRENAADIINVYKSTLRTTEDLEMMFPYASIYPSELRTLVDGDQYEDYIIALIEEFDEETVRMNKADFENVKNRFMQYSILDVAQAENLLNRIPGRLLTRDHGVITTYLDDEITSAENMIGTTNDGTYTARSWAKYIEAYNEALEVQADPTQMTVFDAKYNLMISRNELVKVEDEADYTELEALIAQAQMALNNTNLYDNTNKDFGMVLAELGYHDFENEDGDAIQLFYGSALHENAEPYAVDEQNKVDAAATALKEALARLKFKNVSVTGATVTEETLVEADEEAGIEAVTAEAIRLDALMDADAVAKKLAASATGVTSADITVSNDIHYTIETTDDLTFTGTNATITFYTTVSGVKVPVTTLKVIVNADVNGDGVIDVLDAAVTELTSNEHAELEGCYKIAANIGSAATDIDNADYAAVVNKVLAA